MSTIRRGIAALCATLALIAAVFPALAEPPVISIGTLENGTVNWELQTILEQRLDRENGFKLEVVSLAGNPATQIAMQGGEVDSIVSDWLWVARQRASGADFTFLPYSTAVGGLVVPKDSDVQDLADLEGQKIGIAGGPVDKSWLILRAWNRQQNGEDLTDVTGQVFGAPPVIRNAAETGEIAGAVNFWHYLAKMKAGGMREVISVSKAAADLGLDPTTPLLGYVLRDSWIEEHPELAQGLATASRQAKELLAGDDAVWEDIRPIMNAADDAEFEALREGWHAGIPPQGDVDRGNAQRMFSIMADLGGEELTGGLTELPEGLFWSGE
ncbi:ABC transporter substrate-binding protein [Paracoccus saliphilus]|uniref:ABC transporter substrate-binding protein n=1 Tax=Paracoccus saliphilus TaxID=405559 RepID=A0AA45W1C5_9RHOB|nr:ABC transporter substrate-binding protein [Paracoccus saliphilus]WCR03574.1 ABC transporter substrate-binding protein [Paracoccus saliphilus]SIS56000.1 NitT/TauT family transport system substrate-binding protein [Paracoccus saliphilus]